MKYNAKIRSGAKFLFSEGFSNDWVDLTDDMIINFNDRYIYKGFKQKKNHLIISVITGTIDIVFVSDIPKLEFDHFCKDQLVLKIIKEDE